MKDPLVSIILRSYNEAWALRDTLPALRAQDYENYELIAIDSSSTDGSIELIREASPRHFVQIKACEYNPGRVMNAGMRLAASKFCIFINADATPQNSHWLRPLVKALQDSKTAAVFGRQVPRPDCRAVFACDYSRCFGENRESAGWTHFFSMVSSGLRKDIWSRRGFLETIQYAEDHEYTLWCRKLGYKVVYCPESVVIHSHNYTPGQAFKRTFGDARALAAARVERPGRCGFLRTVLLGWAADAHRDFLYCRKMGVLREWPHAARVRWAKRRGWLEGLRTGWREQG